MLELVATDIVDSLLLLLLLFRLAVVVPGTIGILLSLISFGFTFFNLNLFGFEISASKFDLSGVAAAEPPSLTAPPPPPPDFILSAGGGGAGGPFIIGGGGGGGPPPPFIIIGGGGGGGGGGPGI